MYECKNAGLAVQVLTITTNCHLGTKKGIMAHRPQPTDTDYEAGALGTTNPVTKSHMIIADRYKWVCVVWQSSVVQRGYKVEL